ncbi:hypothetical protein HPDP_00312 [Candidatus Hepatincola sp. Pdp]
MKNSYSIYAISSTFANSVTNGNKIDNLLLLQAKVRSSFNFVSNEFASMLAIIFTIISNTIKMLLLVVKVLVILITRKIHSILKVSSYSCCSAGYIHSSYLRIVWLLYIIAKN